MTILQYTVQPIPPNKNGKQKEPGRGIGGDNPPMPHRTMSRPHRRTNGIGVEDHPAVERKTPGIGDNVARSTDQIKMANRKNREIGRGIGGDSCRSLPCNPPVPRDQRYRRGMGGDHPAVERKTPGVGDNVARSADQRGGDETKVHQRDGVETEGGNKALDNSNSMKAAVVDRKSAPSRPHQIAPPSIMESSSNFDQITSRSSNYDRYSFNFTTPLPTQLKMPSPRERSSSRSRSRSPPGSPRLSIHDLVRTQSAKYSAGWRAKSPPHPIPIQYYGKDNQPQYRKEWIKHQEIKAENAHKEDDENNLFTESIKMVSDGRAQLLVNNGYNMYGQRLTEGRNFFDKPFDEEYEMFDWLPQWVQLSKSRTYMP